MIFVFQHKCFTAIHKHYSIEEWIEFKNNHQDVLGFVAVSSGTSDSDWDRLQQILGQNPEVKLCFLKCLFCLFNQHFSYHALIASHRLMCNYNILVLHQPLLLLPDNVNYYNFLRIISYAGH